MSILNRAGFVTSACFLGCTPGPSSPSPPQAVDIADTPPPGSSAPQGDTASSPPATAWKAAARVSFVGDALLGCHAEKISGWARVVCDGRHNPFGGVLDIAVDAAATRTTLSKFDVVVDSDQEEGEPAWNVVTFPWQPGATMTASLMFPVEVVVLRASWPQGAAEPAVPIVARGVPDVSAEAVKTFLCGCRPPTKTLAPPGSPLHGPCVLGDVLARLECLRTHLDGDDCGGWLECEMRTPTGYAECLPGEVHNTALCVSCNCSIACGSGKASCPPGMECTEGIGEVQTCERLM